MCSSGVVLFRLCCLGGIKTSTGLCDVVQSASPVGELLWGGAGHACLGLAHSLSGRCAGLSALRQLPVPSEQAA